MLKNLLKHKLFVYLLVCFIWSGVNAQTIPYLSVDDAIVIGLRQNFQLIIDSNNVEASSIRNSPGNAGFLPQLNVNSNILYSDQTIKQQYSNGTELNHNNATTNTRNISAAVSWTLFDGGRMFATAKLLRLQEDQSRLISKDDIQNLMATIINAYYNVVQQKQLLVQIDSSLKYYDVQLITSQNLKLHGKGTQQQIFQSQIDRNTEEAQYYAQLNSLLDAKTNLNHLLQRSPDLDFEVGDSIPVTSGTADTTRQFLTEHNPFLLEASRNVNIQTAILQQNKSLYFPQLSVIGGYGFNNSSSSASFFLLNQNLGWNAGVTLGWNLFDGFRTRNLVEVSKINIENARINYEQAVSNTEASVSIAYHKYKTALQQMMVLKQNLQLAEENLRIALEEFKLYAITQIELQQAHRSYDDVSAAYITSLYAVKSAETNLQMLNGSLVQ
ncbi:MAG: TolC family protein [Chitinophagales bacterium]|nr:TolC family protein [Chitinophagales bacterium]